MANSTPRRSLRAMEGRLRIRRSRGRSSYADEDGANLGAHNNRRGIKLAGDCDDYKQKFRNEIATLVDIVWFARYPRPLYCIHDNGGKFIGSGFQELLNSYGVKSKPTTVKNP